MPYQNPERLKVSSGDPLLMLCEIRHSTLITPIYIVQDDTDLVHAGVVYVALPFRLTLPTREGATLPQATLEVDNVSQILSDFAEYIATAESATVKLKQVFRSLPDTIEWEASFTANSIKVDQLLFTATLGMENILDRPASSRRYDPYFFPGAFQQ